MGLQESLKKYAHLIVHKGCNLKKGQELYISARLEAASLVRLVTEEAYKAGAKTVTLDWSDEKTSRLRYDYEPLEEFEHFPKWKSEMYNGVAERGGAILSILSDDPLNFAGVDPKKVTTSRKASKSACKSFYDGMDFGHNVWCIVGAASPVWAKRVFPNLPGPAALSRLWEAIFHSVRVDTPDPEKAWDEHRRSFEKRCAFLNEKQFDKLVYHNSIGTDITLGMPKNHVWQGGGSQTVDGVYYFPNMPTEEIFCTPDRTRTNGTVHSALPLSYQGVMIDDFSITFQDGKAVSCSAATGEDALQAIIDTDDGSKMLGECALIPNQSPISDMGILFYNTLYDENAACHFALGMGFPECVKGGLDKTKEDLMKLGINDSSTHVDFMLGTKDLSITGITADGEEVPIFRNGNWDF
ncbi:MAG: aminopeptidase [Oscillospiraceae bacterium]|jgi:aminopeptidase|nr:aminopeptidase [Oscillospiraceae bacterium]